MRKVNSLQGSSVVRAGRNRPQPGCAGAIKSRFTGLGVVVALSWSLSAASLEVPNGSFESPTPPPGFPATPLIDDWQKTSQPDWFDPDASGIEWFQVSGVFPNTPSGSGDHIENMDGAQAAYMFALPEVGLFQEMGATYEAGMTYELTVGLMGAGGINEGSAFELGLYYRDVTDQPVSLATTPIVFSAEGFAEPNLFYDYRVSLAEVQASDDWAGREIGVQLLSTFGDGAGYWNVDNVRLTAVPEPSGLVLLAVGLGGLAVGCRRWKRGRA